MGHMVAKDVYRELGTKIDNLHVKAPCNDTFYQILKDLYSSEEAELIVKMPYVLSGLDRIQRITGIDKPKLEKILDDLCHKGLVMDMWLDGEYKYMPSPLFVGIFEFTMMRLGGGVDFKRIGRLFFDYMEEGAPFRSNFPDKAQLSIARAVPHEEAIGDHVEILEYERVTALIDESDKYSVGNCSCRHKLDHVGQDRCDVPLNTCTSLGRGADYLIRNNMAHEISRTEMKEIFARSREMGLVFSADNVQKRITFVCHCCSCCCSIMHGINVLGLPQTLVTSNFIASVDEMECTGCKKCVKACPINAIELVPVDSSGPNETKKKKRKKRAQIDTAFCLGCGVCTLTCSTKSLKLVRREQRVIHPETTFERVILQCLERGTLQNQIFDNPQSKTQEFMRHLIGGFFRLSPVKKTLMSDSLRSTFLRTMAAGVKLTGKGYVTQV